MAKKVQGYIKLQVPAGSANPSPPIGPALGQRGLNIMQFCKDFNSKTAEMPKGQPTPVVITYFTDKSFSFEFKTPPASFFLKQAAKLDTKKKPGSGSKLPGRTFVGQVSLAQVNSPEMGTIEGVHAREYSMEQLLNAVVFLDKDDLAGTYADGGIPCLVYLSGSGGKPNLNRNFNKMIVDAGYATIINNTHSEFDPALW